MIGLVISAIVPNSDLAMSFLPLLLLPQVVFSRTLFPLNSPALQIIGMLFPVCWSIAALGSTVGIHADKMFGPSEPGDKLFDNDYSYHGTLFSLYSQVNATWHLIYMWGALAIIIVLLLSITTFALCLADLLLALAMLFLIANTVSQPKPPSVHAHITPTSTSKVITPPRLEQGYHRFSITIDPNALLNNDVNEQNHIIQQVKSQGFLRGRNAGLVIIYGGAPPVNDIPTATSIANDVYSILLSLGKQDVTFARLSKYDPLYLLGGDPTIVKLDIFLFSQ